VMAQKQGAEAKGRKSSGKTSDFIHSDKAITQANAKAIQGLVSLDDAKAKYLEAKEETDPKKKKEKMDQAILKFNQAKREIGDAEGMFREAAEVIPEGDREKDMGSLSRKQIRRHIEDFVPVKNREEDYDSLVREAGNEEISVWVYAHPLFQYATAMAGMLEGTEGILNNGLGSEELNEDKQLTNTKVARLIACTWDIGRQVENLYAGKRMGERYVPDESIGDKAIRLIGDEPEGKKKGREKYDALKPHFSACEKELNRLKREMGTLLKQVDANLSGTDVNALMKALDNGFETESEAVSAFKAMQFNGFNPFAVAEQRYILMSDWIEDGAKAMRGPTARPDTLSMTPVKTGEKQTHDAGLWKQISFVGQYLRDCESMTLTSGKHKGKTVGDVVRELEQTPEKLLELDKMLGVDVKKFNALMMEIMGAGVSQESLGGLISELSPFKGENKVLDKCMDQLESAYKKLEKGTPAGELNLSPTFYGILDGLKVISKPKDARGKLELFQKAVDSVEKAKSNAKKQE
ncbi:MAG: hypothetical protein ABIG39_04570, partial [Candidatus Micrarchaeota archaeon]